jgi:signal transduction histidine kinase
MKSKPVASTEMSATEASQALAARRSTLLWLAGLLAVLTTAAVLLALFLREVETQEDERRRAADAQWLEQTLRFHFARLERDLGQLPAGAPAAGAAPPRLERAGLLWRGDGVIAWQGWLDAGALSRTESWPAPMVAAERQVDGAGALAIMLDTGRGLQRAAFAGPLRSGQDGAMLWLALPCFERGRYLGSQVAAIRLERALEQIVPAWFLVDHALHTVDEDEHRPASAAPDALYPVALQLPGAQWKLAVELLQPQPALAPRAFLGIALACLGLLLAALHLLRQGSLQRRQIERLAARRQQQLEASARLVTVGEVASTLAHELNQPLGALSSFASGLLNRVRQGSITLPELVPVLERIERLAEKAGRVIQRVNAFARRQEMSRQPLALSAFVRRVAHQLPLPENVELQLELPDDGPRVSADALLLEHALRNLILNAGEWAMLGRRHPALVRVSLLTADAMAGIQVEDNGPGMTPEQRAGIFEAFTSRKPGGMGMGLSICRSIVEAHHGRIEVGDSQALGGAQFMLWLPLTN